jgi:hypothetical protein
MKWQIMGAMLQYTDALMMIAKTVFLSIHIASLFFVLGHQPQTFKQV